MRIRLTIFVYCFALFISYPLAAGAANHYIRAGASVGSCTSTGSGCDWTNACTAFTGPCAIGSLVRGDTYYVATGAYPGVILNTAVSGTSIITIRGATISNHGTSTGWSNAYSVDQAEGGTQATWIYDIGTNQTIGFSTSYWAFDGTVGTGATTSAYGFFLPKPSDCATRSNSTTNVTIPTRGSGLSPHDITVRHTSHTACAAGNFNTDAFGVGCGACSISNVTIGNNYSTGNTGYFNTTNMSNSTLEYNVGDSFFTVPGVHAEVISVTSFSAGASGCLANKCSTNVILRYNIFKNIRSTGAVECLRSGGDPIDLDSWQIYGNVFVDDQSGDGIISPGGNCGIANTIVYNNTCINCGKFFVSCGGTDNCPLASGNVIKNNLLVNSSSVITNVDVINGSGASGPAVDHDYNTFWNPRDAGTTETHGQIVLGGACPLSNCAIDVTGVYTLLADAIASCASTTTTCAGLTLSAPYNTDLTGFTRGADSTWERGAYEFNSGGLTPPGAPTNFGIAWY